MIDDTDDDHNEDRILSDIERRAIVSTFVTDQAKDVEENGDLYWMESNNNDPIVCSGESSAVKFDESNDIEEKFQLQQKY